MSFCDFSNRRTTHFLLWRPVMGAPPPRVVIGRLRHGNPPIFLEERRPELRPSPGRPGLWEIAASECALREGDVYHYWFEVTDTNPYKSVHPRILVTDPTAWAVDWRLLAPPLAAPGFGEDDRDPSGVIKFQGGTLRPSDPGGEEMNWDGDAPINSLPANNRLVIYELPTTWTRFEEIEAPVQLGIGTFRDVLALVESGSKPANFSGLPVLEKGRAHLKDLGVNALELLPPADSFVDREWGYATSNYFAADHDLGFPRRHLSPTATTDLSQLIKACHGAGIRFFLDVVMAFATRYSYQNISFLDFHVQADAGDPEEFDQGRRRDGFGGDLFKYNFWTEGYDPVSGHIEQIVPARRLMLTHIARWIEDFRIDGIRMDSVANIANWDFVQECRNLARELWHRRASAEGLADGEADARFLVVGEELAVPRALVTEHRLDGLWNEDFKRMVRHALLGEADENEPSFEWMVRKMIDCRLLGFTDCTQVVNYVTSHDVEGFRNERLYDFLRNNGVVETEQRIKLAFACLLTSVGIPMIFAGEEFADEHDLPPVHPQKQVDPVNFDRIEAPFRKRIFDYVARLVKLRVTYDALAVNDSNFIHVDFDGKRVLAWRRGQENTGSMVVVVANFSDYGTPEPSNPSSEYLVHNWPATPPGRGWREITQGRDVPHRWVAREPIFPWEAKVYALV